MKNPLLVMTAVSLCAGIAHADLIPPISASASTEIRADRGAQNAINGTDVTLAPGADPDTPADYTSLGNTGWGIGVTWQSGTGNADDQWFAVEFDDVYVFESMNFFNIGAQGQNIANRGTLQADIYYRVGGGLGNNSHRNATAFDPEGWTLLGTAGSQTFSLGPDGITPQAPDTVSLNNIQATAVALDMNTNQGAGNGVIGINEVQFFGKPAPADPQLTQDKENGDASLNYGTVFRGPGEPAETPVRTIRYENTGATQDIEITSVSIDGGFEITDIGKNGTGGQTPPLTLLPGDFIDISVKGVPSPTGMNSTISSALVVDTDEDRQDKSMPADAKVYAAGDLMNRNFSFEAGGGGAANWSQNHARVSPGIAPGSTAMVRVVGIGDTTNAPGLTLYGQANQTQDVDDGASDFESVFYFSPIDPSSWDKYTWGPLSGGTGDRTMQYMILADNNDVRNGNPIGFDQDTNVIVNLAYLPDGNTSGGTPGLYVYNGGTFGWELAVAKTLAGSIDANDDGILDVSTGDTVNAHKVVVKGVGFGTPAASYTITVDSTTSAPLTAWHAASGTSHTLAGHSFTTADNASSWSGGVATPFWVDDAALYNVGTPDPGLVVLQGPDNIIYADRSVGTTGTSTIVLRNDGAASDLVISSATFSDPSFSLMETTPITVAPGAVQDLTIQWDSTVSGNIVLDATASFEHNGNGSPLEYTLGGAVVSPAHLSPNWDFETPGTDAVDDTDTFAFWTELPGDGTGVFDIPGLAPGSDTAARINDDSYLQTGVGTPASDFVAEVWFAIQDTTARAFNIMIVGDAGGQINIRYQGTEWLSYNNVGNTPSGWEVVLDMASNPLLPSVDDDKDGSLDGPTDTKNVYLIRVTGEGWDSETPTFSFDILDSTDTVIGSSTPNIARFQNALPGPAARLDATAQWGNCPGFWVDDYNIRVNPLPEPSFVEITSVSGGTGALTLTYDAEGATVNIERTQSLSPASWSAIATGESSGTYTDNTAPEGGAYYRVVIP